MPNINRRDILKAIGLAPLAGAMGGCSSPESDRAAAAARAASAAAGGSAATAAPTFFTAHEMDTVRVLVDYIIPRDERSGSATDAKVPEFMDAFLSHPDADPEQGAAIRGGLAWLDAEVVRRHAATFVKATDAQRRDVLDSIAWPAKARPELSHGVAFFNRFRDLTASGFFSSQMGGEDLRYQGNVALPSWTGCPPAALAKLGVSYEVMKGRVQPQSRG
jgi:hypothetical protein